MPHDAVEWKLFRRINDGPLTLVGQDADRTLAGETVTTEDAALPGAPSTRICYFLQVFNANGMNSPLVRLDCFDVAHGGFQQPLLTPLTPLADAGDGQRRARLRFFAPAAGTERFEIWVGALPNITPDVISDQLSPDISNGGVISLLDGLEDFQDRTFRVFETPRLGGTFGAAAPDFEIEIELPAGADYAFAVRPVGSGPWAPTGDEAGASRLAGPFSNIETFRWHAPDDEDPDQVPWPALDTPPVHNGFHPMADARVLPAGFGGGVGFRIGEFTIDEFLDERIYAQPDNTPPHFNFFPSDLTLDEVLYRARESNFVLSPESERMRSLLPGVLYRYQIDGPLGAVSDRIVQVSPLVPADLEDFLFTFSDSTIRLILDTFVQAVRDDEDDFVGDPSYGLYLLDTMPVAAGATYGYLLVLFDDDGEINRVVPSQPRANPMKTLLPASLLALFLSVPSRKPPPPSMNRLRSGSSRAISTAMAKPMCSSPSAPPVFSALVSVSPPAVTTGCLSIPPASPPIDDAHVGKIIAMGFDTVAFAGRETNRINLFPLLRGHHRATGERLHHRRGTRFRRLLRR